MVKVVIVIPTYNEREQTPRMIEALAKLFKTIKKYDMHLLYADDSSPDKTYEVVREKMKKYPWLHLVLNKEKAGIGGGYITGFRYAMKELGADYVMEFDSDFQHRVEDIPVLLAKIDEDYDLVIGSRYVKGGSIPAEWGLKRKFFSVVGNLVCRVGFLMPQIHDFTTGFKLTKVKGNLDEYDLDKLYYKNFAYKIQMTAEMVNSGKKVVEVPIQFQPRVAGESKLIKNEIRYFLMVILLFQLHNPKMQRFVKFGVVGGTGFVVNYLGLEVLKRFGLSTYFATLFATEAAIISNFIFNNIWTFKDKKITKVKDVIPQFIKFNLTSLFAVIVQPLIVTLATKIFADTSLVRFGGLLSALVIVLIYNYTVYNLFIWKTWKLPWAKEKASA